MSSEPEKVTTHWKVNGHPVSLTVDARYTVEAIIGQGSYGVVASGVDTLTGERVAIKKIQNIFQSASEAVSMGVQAGAETDSTPESVHTWRIRTHARRCLREVKLQGMFDHPCVLKVRDIMTIPVEEAPSFREVYVVFDLMDADLSDAVQHGSDFSIEHAQWFLYQILTALVYIHSASCVHRDLKPRNVLLDTATCEVRICDFGLVKQIAPPPYLAMVVSRYYRAPEVYLNTVQAQSGIDVWAAGMILAFFLRGSPFLQGASDAHQLQLLLATFGRPPQHLIDGYAPDVAEYVSTFPYPERIRSIREHFPNPEIPDTLIDLLSRMLVFDPDARISAAEALQHPFFLDIRQPELELVATQTVPLFAFEEQDVSIDAIRQLIFNEMLLYHPEYQALYGLVHDPAMGMGNGHDDDGSSVLMDTDRDDTHGTHGTHDDLDELWDSQIRMLPLTVDTADDVSVTSDPGSETLVRMAIADSPIVGMSAPFTLSIDT